MLRTIFAQDAADSCQASDLIKRFNKIAQVIMSPSVMGSRNQGANWRRLLRHLPA
jgi:hypothetical protein